MQFNAARFWCIKINPRKKLIRDQLPEFLMLFLWFARLFLSLFLSLSLSFLLNVIEIYKVVL